MKCSRILFHIFISLILVSLNEVTAQSVPIQKDSLLKKIQQLQSTGDDFYPKGLFPNERYLHIKRKIKADNNVFYAGLIAYTLQSYKNSFSTSGQHKIDSIVQHIQHNFARYGNRKGGPTYNFYPTHPDNPFPNTFLLSKIKKFRLPDDFDDTSILWLTKNSTDSSMKEVKKIMYNYSNNKRKKSSNIMPAYRNINMYTTWFGKKMKQDFDVCVMSNTLLFVLKNKLPLTSVDSGTIEYIKQLIFNKEYIHHPEKIAPHYFKTSIILYHVTRLVIDSKTDHFELLKPTLIEAITAELPKAKNSIEQTLLLSSLYKLGLKPTWEINYSRLERDLNEFVFFVGSPFAGAPIWIKNMVDVRHQMNYKYRCKAYYYCLLLEYECLKNSSVQLSP